MLCHWLLNLVNYLMPHKTRASAASARNGSMSGEVREAKRQKVERQGMGMAEDKEVTQVSWFFIMDIV